MFVAFRGVFGGRGRGYAHPYYFWIVYMAVLPNQILRKKIYANRWVWGHMRSLYIILPYSVSKKFLRKPRVEAMLCKLAFYILRRLAILEICAQWLLRGFQKMAKWWQKPFVKIDNAKIAVCGQTLRKVNLIYPLDKFCRFVL